VRARAIVTLLDEVGSDDPAAGVAKALADIRRLMQAVARQGSVVDEFIAERRREAGRE